MPQEDRRARKSDAGQDALERSPQKGEGRGEHPDGGKRIEHRDHGREGNRVLPQVGPTSRDKPRNQERVIRVDLAQKWGKRVLPILPAAEQKSRARFQIATRPIRHGGGPTSGRPRSGSPPQSGKNTPCRGSRAPTVGSNTLASALGSLNVFSFAYRIARYASEEKRTASKRNKRAAETPAEVESRKKYTRDPAPSPAPAPRLNRNPQSAMVPFPRGRKEGTQSVPATMGRTKERSDQ
jgi:hypothetical protein